MTKEILARRNEGIHLKTLCMHQNKFIIKSANSAIMAGVDYPDIFVAFVEPGHTYIIYVKYTNVLTQETYERVRFMSGYNVCYEVYVTDSEVKINIRNTLGAKDILRIHAYGEMSELCAVIELIDMTNICKELDSKDATKTETDEYVYAKSDNTEIPFI